MNGIVKGFSKEFLLNLYRTMVAIRHTEESLVELINDKTIQCPCHLYSGQEAVATGVCAALEREDVIFGNHRSHGHFLAKGGNLSKMIAEIYGLDAGCARGRGGSMHVIDRKIGMMGAAPIVAGTISLAVGAALASSIRGNGKVTVSFFGDGATGEGALYESLNFAALRKLPLIFVCENNLYSTHMPIRECRPRNAIYEVAKPFGIKSMRIDGNDVLRVYAAARRSVSACRGGDGPVFMECMTYRLRGHVGPDDCVQGLHTDIRPPAEIEKWERKDPIKRFKAKLLRLKLFRREDLEVVERGVHSEVLQAHSFASRCQLPERGDLLNYVFKG